MTRITLTAEQAQQIEEALEGIQAIMSDSKGVAGYHLNGEMADWDYFDDVNGIDEALSAIRAAIAQEQEPVAYLCDGARYKVMGEDRSGFGRILGLPESLAGQWVALVDATDGKHLRAAPVQQVEQEPEYKGWYCAHCERGVDGSEVTFHEQHEVCGRVITNDVPPKPVMQEPVAWLYDWEHEGEIVTGWVTQDFETTKFNNGHNVRPLYAAPVRTKDLTDEELNAMWYGNTKGGWIGLLRAVIAADREKNK